MGFVFNCESCGKRLTVPPNLYEKRFRGRVVTISCKACGAPLRVDATEPPPPLAEGGKSASSASKLLLDPAIPRAPRLPGSTSASPASGSGPPSAPAPGSQRKRSSPPPLPKSSVVPPPLPRSEAGRNEGIPGPFALSPSRSMSPFPRFSSEPPRAPSSSPTRRDIVAPTFGASGDDDEASSPPEPESPISHVDGPISTRQPIAKIGRYALFDKFASGGMATLHLGRLDGAGGFSRVVAIKRLLPHLVKDGEFAEMLLNEARLAARVHHPNVVPTLDVVASKGEVLLVLEYVHGESLSTLCRAQAKRNELVPLSIAVNVMLSALEGLHAVHEATDERGRSLGMVHRDVSPPNVIVGVDGMARVLDFGIVKALEQLEETVPNRLKGKTGYMSPEQIRAERVTRASDIFAAGIVLWELLTLRRFAAGAGDKERLDKIMAGNYPRPSVYRPELGDVIDAVVMRALAFDPKDRYATAREFGAALASVAEGAPAGVVADWVRSLAASGLSGRARLLAQVENWEDSAPDIELNSTPFAVERDILALASVTTTPTPLNAAALSARLAGPLTGKTSGKSASRAVAVEGGEKPSPAGGASKTSALDESEGARFPLYLVVAALALIGFIAAYSMFR